MDSSNLTRAKKSSALCSIYRNDAFTFLNREHLWKARQVSWGFNSDIIGKLPALARRHCTSFSITSSSKSILFDKKGFATGNGVERGEYPWHSVACARHFDCCKHLASTSAQLTGQRICPTRSNTDAIRIVVCPNANPDRKKTQKVVYHAQNELTPSTAFGLVHLLSHLRDVEFYRLCIYTSLSQSSAASEDNGGNGSVLNSLIGRVMSSGTKPWRIHANYVQPIADGWLHRVANLTQEFVQTISTDVKARNMCFVMQPESIKGSLSLILNGRPICSKATIHVSKHVKADFVDQVVRVRLAHAVLACNLNQCVHSVLLLRRTRPRFNYAGGYDTLRRAD